MSHKTIRARIIDLVFEALKACPSVAEENVEIARSSPAFDRPALTLSDLGEDVVDQDWMIRRATLKLHIFGEVEGDGGAGVTDAINSLWLEVYLAITTDVQWTGLAENTEVGGLEISITPDADVRTADFGTEITITYSHRTNDPTAQ